MTLVGTSLRNDENALPMMLSVQQQHHHHHHHHHHSGLHGGVSGSPLSGNNGQNLRGNVIVSTGGLTSGNDVKSSMQQHGCKRSKTYQSTSPYGTVPHQPASVARRNARERNRVKQVNNGFATLRQHIPQSVAQALGGNTAGTHGGSRAGSKKLSKVETLRMAVEYIRSLQRLLDDHDGTDGSSVISSSSSSSPASSTRGTGSVASSGIRGDHLQADIGHRAELRTTSVSSDLDGHGNTADSGHQHLRENPSPTSFVPAPCSEASSSPTPSFVSEASSSAGSQGYGSTSTNGALYATHGDSYDNYEPMSPEDEELLDVISWWQQSQ